MTLTPQRVEIPALDGQTLVGWLHEPEAWTGEHAVLVNPAMGVPCRFYRRMATYLAGQGCLALTFDYRGIGGSAPEDLTSSPARMRDWGELDIAGAIAWMTDEHEPGKLVCLAHSVGGQVFGLAPNSPQVERLYSVGSVKGYLGLWPWHQRLLLAGLWYAVVPAVTWAAGYFPARLVGLGGEDLPPKVAMDWRRWGTHPDYLIDDEGQALHEGFAKWRGAVRAVSLTDDWYAPAGPVEAWLALFENAERSHQRLAPRDVGLDEIGHFGFFREPARRAGLWDQALAWLLGDEGSQERV